VSWLEPSLGSIHAEHSHSAPFIAMACGLAAAGVGIGLAYSFYYKGSDVPAKLAAQFSGLHRLLLDKWRVDELYDATVLGGSRGLARLCANFDKYVVDGILTQLSSQAVAGISFLFTRFQSGLVHAYGAVMAVGLFFVAFHFVVPHADPEVVGDPTGLSVELAANQGLGYEYRWDFDADGEFDTAWTRDAKTEHAFNDADIVRFAVVFEGAGYGARARTMVLAPKQDISVSSGPLTRFVTRGELSLDELGETWRAGDSSAPPSIKADEHGLVIKPHGARVRKAGVTQPADAEIHVARGEHVSIGEARLSVSGYVKPRVQVRNAFGMERTESVGVVVPKVPPRITAEIARVQGIK
jgi:NADH-quinone oxidoreductase subunit L